MVLPFIFLLCEHTIPKGEKKEEKKKKKKKEEEKK